MKIFKIALAWFSAIASTLMSGMAVMAILTIGVFTLQINNQAAGVIFLVLLPVLMVVMQLINIICWLWHAKTHYLQMLLIFWAPPVGLFAIAAIAGTPGFSPGSLYGLIALATVAHISAFVISFKN